MVTDVIIMRKEDRTTESLAIAKAIVCTPNLKKPFFLTSTAGTSLECNISRWRSISGAEEYDNLVVF